MSTNSKVIDILKDLHIITQRTKLVPWIYIDNYDIFNNAIFFV